MNYQNTPGFKEAAKLIGKLAATKAYYLVGSTRKLSDMYNSQSTTYAKCLDMPPFIINRNTDAIVAAGFSKACKAIITVDETHPAAISLIKSRAELLEAQRIEEQRQQDEADAVVAEAATIIPDADFINDLRAITATGPQKSELCAAAFKALLARLNIEWINSDFWKVFRIVKHSAGL